MIDPLKMNHSLLRKHLFVFASLLLLISSFRKGLDLRQQIDLAPTYVAAHLLWSGKSDSIYDNSAYGGDRSPEWIEFERNEMQGIGAETTFIYLPAYLVFISPLVMFFNFAQFKVIFLLLKIPFLAWFFSSIALRWPGNLKWGAVLIGVLCLSDAVLDGFRLGQNVEFLAVLVPAYFLASAKSRHGLCTLLLILAILVKPWAAVLILYPATALRIRQTAIQITAILILLFVQWLFFPEAMIDFIRLVGDHNGISILSYNNLSFDAFIHKLSFRNWMQHFGWNPAPERPQTIATILRLFFAALLAGVALFSRVGNHRRLAILLIPPIYMNIFWNHYLLLYFPFFADSVRRSWNYPVRRALVLAIIVLVLWTDAEGTRWLVNSVLLRGLALNQLSFALPFVHFLGVLVLLWMLLIRTWKQGQNGQLRTFSFLAGKLWPIR